MEISELQSKWEIEFKKGFAKPLILLILTEKENYPYQITKEIFTITQGQLSIATSNIYPILKNLKEEGMISENKDIKTRRIMYHITKKGLELSKSITFSINSFINVLHEVINLKGVDMNS
ncbi:MAG: PadR family transcriptional regulator [Promethearchaeota archaeon]